MSRIKKNKESGLQTRQMRGTEEIIKGCMLDLIGLGGGVLILYSVAGT